MPQAIQWSRRCVVQGEHRTSIVELWTSCAPSQFDTVAVATVPVHPSS